MRYRNPTDAFLSSLEAILSQGEEVVVRGSRTLEMLSQSLTYENPLERCITVPHRNNNIFASIAETVWVIAGRDDIGFLAPYLPRAEDFSDDGMTWRGAYGPRLRNWEGVDQLESCLSLLQTDPESRRAVMAIFDPSRDFEPSRDIPCTNWLHVMVRNEAVHLEVVMRSNDIMWGFSGINSFEWSVLVEMLAEWLDVGVGSVTFFVSSLHLYGQHETRARKIISHSRPTAWPAGRRQFSTSFDDLPELLTDWFRVEELVRQSPTNISLPEDIRDPLFRDFARMIQFYWLHQSNELELADSILAKVVDPGLRFAAREYRSRNDPQTFWDLNDLDDKAARNEELLSTLIDLHTGKDIQYGDSWKKRGEFASIVNNIARKADRLARWDVLSPPSPEIFDSIADLTIYATKYSLFLYEMHPELACRDLQISDAFAISTGPAGVSTLLGCSGEKWLAESGPTTVEEVLSNGDAILDAFRDADPVLPSEARLHLSLALAGSSLKLLSITAKQYRSVFLEWRLQSLAAAGQASTNSLSEAGPGTPRRNARVEHQANS